MCFDNNGKKFLKKYAHRQPEIGNAEQLKWDFS